MSTSVTAYNHKINNSDYIFKVTLVSAAGGKSRAQDIKPTAIKELFISDSFKDFFQQGYIIINNSQDVIERDTPDTQPYNKPAYYNNAGSTTNGTNPDDPDGATSNADAGFLFRGESRDILRIDIMPRLDNPTIDSLGSAEGRKYFYIGADFAIYDSEEIIGESPGQKYKKLYFWDLYYQLMLEKNVQFSTANVVNYINSTTPGLTTTTSSPSATLPQNADNSDRAVTTGTALKEFLKAAFPDNEKYPISFSVTIPGVDNTQGLSQQDQDQQNIDWDLGGTNLFFSTPANFKAIDCVKYIMQRHVSNSNSNFDQCFLRLTGDKREFTFKSLSQYFKQAYNPETDTPGDYYLETVKIGGNTQQDGKSNVAPYFTPSTGVYFERIGTIKSFSFDNMAGIHAQQRLVPTFVHSYDTQNKQFNIDIERNGIEQAMKTYQQNYINHMNSSSEEPAFTNFAPGQLRYQNKNVQNIFSVSEQDPDQRLAWGRNEFLYASIFTNNLISFRLPGSTHREAGSFIGIDRDGAIPNSKFDNKLLGIYFIVEVKHSFTGNEFFNDLFCIKVYNFKQLDDTYTGNEKTTTGDSLQLKGLVSNGL
jgi:hypothetical protein